MYIEIKISGSGNNKEIAASLRQIANSIVSNETVEKLNEVGEATIEDGNLIADISEELI
jgi:hypothetical protein